MRNATGYLSANHYRPGDPVLVWVLLDAWERAAVMSQMLLEQRHSK